MKHLLVLCVLALGTFRLAAQEVPVSSSSVDAAGCIHVAVESSADSYYILFCHDASNPADQWPVAMALGTDGTTEIVEPLAALPVERYRVMKYSIAAPSDTDGDGIDDVQEFNNMPATAPFNPAASISMVDGCVSIPDRETFETLSYKGQDVKIDTHLKDLEFVKFYILDANSGNPKVYFMNTQTHRAHGDFARAVGISSRPGGGGTSGQMRGEIVYHPNAIAPNGAAGLYRFEFEPNDSYTFEKVQMAYELFAANMPLLRNNFAYYPMPNAALPRYYQEKSLYDASRVAIVLEEDIYGTVGYQALNMAEGYGLLKVMPLEERPNTRDIVIYEALPNELSRVGGIITTVAQTPLSHVNLRAIQDNVPNSYIAGALAIDSIDALLGKYVYYKVSSDTYTLREATLDEVEAWYAGIRPTDTQYPERDLGTTDIKPLDEINFADWKSFGVKAANVATMRKFGFPDGTIPDGFGVPFYFYDEFMKYNGFYDTLTAMMAVPDFLTDYNVQDDMLDHFRDIIKDADMPQWMLDALETMQNAFPEGTSIRCRSSTNNEDLPGFSGAGLYDSKTQHPEEGHIQKSIKQVYASLWNFRAFDERQFYRIDHYAAAMGVLVHQNYSDELANGVGVSTDPIYDTQDTYYLNTQIGEDLVTNPDALSVPEEILLSTTSSGSNGYTIVRESNQVAAGQQIMSVQHLDEMRTYLKKIHEEFRMLYSAENQEDFAMEIEYKITADVVLSIKQARPWVVTASAATAVDEPPAQAAAMALRQNYPNPFNPTTTISYTIGNGAFVSLQVFSLLGKPIHNLVEAYRQAGTHEVLFDAAGLPSGYYIYRLTAGGTTQSRTMLLLR